MRRSLSLVGIGWITLVACGGTESSTFEDGGLGTPDGGSLVEGGGGIDSGGILEDPDTGPPVCTSQTFCGTTCCAVGNECVDGACTAACTTGGVHCGALCCASGEVCLAAACVPPGITCQDSFDCAETEFCEPTIQKCLPQPSSASVCEYRPPVLPLAPKVEWSWTDSLVKPGFNQVVNTPIVVDLDKDLIPKVIIVTQKGDNTSESDFSSNDPAYLRVLDGKTGLEKWASTVDAFKDNNYFNDGSAADPDYRVNPRATPAAGDLDGKSGIRIVTARKLGGLIAFKADGSLLWTSKKQDGITDYNANMESVTIALADMDNDGFVEIIAGGLVFNHLGFLITDTSIGRQLWGTNKANYGAVSIVADVDGDATTTKQYVVTGNRAIRKDGTFLWDVSATLPDGYPAIADIDKDKTPELVVATQGKIRVQNAVTGALIEEITMPGAGLGGPPTIADFDGDGTMEIASANGTRYSVYEYDSKATPRLSVKWSAVTQDGSSNVTGSSVFDFEGDGKAEVVYNDECYSRVYRGSDGTVLYSVANSSATIHEYPVLVDVDGDNNTEYVIAANDRNHLYGGLKCDYPDGTVPRHGVFVYGDSNDKWVRTRRVWNQHAYHITNVAADGTIPVIESRSWLENNNYRVSSQGKGAYNAPDLRVDLEISTASCPAGLEVRARVKNVGSAGVPAGVDVKIYAGADANAPLAYETTTSKSLLPGETEVVSFVSKVASATYYAVVDGATTGTIINECLEDNNSAKASGVTCPTVN